jgi:hypothetical protein
LASAAPSGYDGAMRIVLAIAATLALTAPALAICPTSPLGGDTSYPNDQTDLIFCQQNELAVTLDKNAEEERLRLIQMELQALDLERQRIMVTPIAPVTFPSLSFETTSF